MTCKILLLSFLFTLTNIALKAQIKAGFTADTTSGCSPLSVQFKDLSTGVITKRTWIFGNGNSSLIKNPKASYATPGKYTVTLIVSDGTKTDTLVRKNYITVFANPQANFIASPPLSGCHPFPVVFTDLSVKGDTAINKWIWDFGDGTTSNLPSPNHTYGLAGSFPVSLQTLDANKCGNTKLVSNYINVSNPPDAVYTSTSTLVACSPPLNVTFSNTSTGTGNLSYLWDFGDGTSSTLKEPNHTYSTYGTFTVKMNVTDPNGCTDSMVKTGFVKVINVIAAFTPSKKIGCKGEAIEFTNNSAGATANAWTFGDGSISSAVSPRHSYAQAGKYPVSLIASSGVSCRDTIRDTITIENIVAKFTSNPHYACKTPFPVNYTDASVNAVDWEWTFGNKKTSTVKNPINVIDTSAGSAPPYKNLISYDDTLIVTSPNGCKDTLILNDNVQLYVVKPDLLADKVKGCAPLTVQFTDKSSPKDSIASWLWTFGDGTTSNLQNPQNTFVNEGNYLVKLTITTKSGCTLDTAIIIKAGIKPQVDFTVNKDSSCASDLVNFTDLSTDPAKIDEWSWTFGDGGGDISKNPSYAYVDTGYMNVALIVGIKGCYDTLTKNNLIYISGPVTKVSVTLDCKSPLVYNFTSTIKAAHRWYWDFGDGSPLDSTSVNPVHTYPSTNPGRGYTVMLTSYNDSAQCRYLSYANPSVREIKAAIATNLKTGCAPLNINFTGITSQDETNYTWHWGDGSRDTLMYLGGISHTYASAGKFKPRLIVADINGCKDTAYLAVGVYKPQANFGLDTLNGCVPATFKFKDQTLADTTLAQRFWSFGDNTFSTDTHPTHTYLQPGNKTVTLIVRDTLGCLDTLSRNDIKVTQPIADFSAGGDKKLCVGESVTFTNLASGTNLVFYKWKFGDGDSLITATSTNPIHTYKDTGSFSVSLMVRESNGCDSVKTMKAYIDVQGIPVPEFEADTVVSNCYPLLVNLTDTSDSKYIQSWLWDFGDNQAGSNIQNPKHNYTSPGIYSVTLALTTTFGCTKSTTKNSYIKVGGPFAEFSLKPDTICKGEEITFTVKNENSYAYSFKWDFGDGSEGNGKTAKHTYNQVGVLFPQLIYYDFDSACEKSSDGTIFIQEVIADFNIDSDSGCVPHPVNVVSTSLGETRWDWNFANGSKSNLKTPATITYANAGLYAIRLAIENQDGCKDTSIKNVLVYPLPGVSVTKDSLICLGESIQLAASGGTTYRWTPKATLNNDSIYNPVASPESTTSYTVVVVDTNACYASKSILVKVQQPPVVTLKDTTIIIGETVSIKAYAGPGFSYSWSPATGLSCTACPDPLGQPLDSTLYTVSITDDNNCFNTQRSAYIRVREAYTIDVPTAFTPNGDDQNDIVYVRGWGIKKLIDFKIYNRWGQLVFESNDIKFGWNGYFKGVLQNMETYVYVVNALMYDEKIHSTKGNISLLR